VTLVSAGSPAGADASVTPASIVHSLLDDDASDTTRETIAKAKTRPQMLALALGSPEFQKR
jgi:hypothetical protein